MSHINQNSSFDSSDQDTTNTSGQGSAALVPKEIQHWNWGAFLLTWIWGLFHHVWWSLLVFIPYAGFIVAIILGVRGSESAWRAQRYNSINEFKTRERKWTIAGIILVVIISILSILAITMMIVINPAEMLKKARDSQRISDLNILKTAINLYLSDSSNPNLGSDQYYYVSNNINPNFTCAGRTAKTSNSQAVDGSGWIPINFSSTEANPITSLPSDPNPGENHYYIYLVDSTTNKFELITNMESPYYSNGGDGDIESTDGGVFPDLYEIGRGIIATPDNCPMLKLLK